MLKNSKSNILSLFVACTIASVVAGAAPASVPGSSEPNPFTFSLEETLTAGAVSAEFPIGTVPGGKYFVVQTVSFWRSGAATGSIGKLFVKTTLAGKASYFTIPNATEDGAGPPGATLSATFYADRGTVLTGDFYRNGDTSGAETVSIVVSGYLVIGKPSD